VGELTRFASIKSAAANKRGIKGIWKKKLILRSQKVGSKDLSRLAQPKACFFIMGAFWIGAALFSFIGAIQGTASRAGMVWIVFPLMILNAFFFIWMGWGIGTKKVFLLSCPRIPGCKYPPDDNRRIWGS
jgi:hypothetical protein